MGDRFYKPKAIEVKRGEQVRFVIRNDGHEDHEFLLDSTEANLKHAEVMKKNPGMEHAEPNGIQLRRTSPARLSGSLPKPGRSSFRA
jgi:uncharacterized cupredoxin-like copper-binding protein